MSCGIGVLWGGWAAGRGAQLQGGREAGLMGRADLGRLREVGEFSLMLSSQCPRDPLTSPIEARLSHVPLVISLHSSALPLRLIQSSLLFLV
jgi:hypothetical protein